MDKKEFDELVRMLQGNVARLIMSTDPAELERMRDWAHRRIDWITDARLQQLNAE